MGTDVDRERQGADRARDAGYVVRDARPADAVEIGRVHIQVWREAYAGLMPAEHPLALDPQASGGRWAEMLASRRTASGDSSRSRRPAR